MPKEGKELLAAYEQALFEGHNEDFPWAGKTPEQWVAFRDELYPVAEVLKPQQIKPKAPPEPAKKKVKAKKK